jgi:hypothetical protein
MKTNIKSKTEPFTCTLATLLLTAAAFCILCSSARAQLYVGEDGTSGVVGEYNPNTGRTINANLITGLNTPSGLAFSGNNLLVADTANNRVGEYDATTGAVINAILSRGCIAHGAWWF